jgi:threonine-phosphate decarboxylase
MQVHGGNIREIARKYRLDEEEVLDFSSNCNPLGFPPGIRSLFQREAGTVLHYPDTLCTELVRALARENGVREKNIMVGNGSTELIYLIPRALKPRRALIINPAFGEYERSLSSMGCEIVCIHLNEKNHFRINTDEIIPLLSRVEILYLCNPGNPTGVLTGRDEIQPLIQAAEKRGVVVVLDEAFMEFSDNHSLAHQVAQRKRLIILRSMTKFFGIPGLRLGYLLAPSAMIAAINMHKEPWSVNTLAQKAGIRCLDDEPFRVKTKRFIERERPYLFSQLAAIEGLKPYASATNFILSKITGKGLTSTSLYEGLAKKGILVRDCRSFRGLGSKFIRVAVKKRKHNNLLISETRKLVERQKGVK